jgi:hypothetical protein
VQDRPDWVPSIQQQQDDLRRQNAVVPAVMFPHAAQYRQRHDHRIGRNGVQGDTRLLDGA